MLSLSTRWRRNAVTMIEIMTSPHPIFRFLIYLFINSFTDSFIYLDNCLTCAGKAITNVSSVTGTDDTVRYVGASRKWTTSSIVHSTFVHIYVLYHINVKKPFRFIT